MCIRDRPLPPTLTLNPGDGLGDDGASLRRGLPRGHRRLQRHAGPLGAPLRPRRARRAQRARLSSERARVTLADERALPAGASRSSAWTSAPQQGARGNQGGG
eukprot:scaffold56229_cov59-Phaeocystis_antarctica.AAC.6